MEQKRERGEVEREDVEGVDEVERQRERLVD